MDPNARERTLDIYLALYLSRTCRESPSLSLVTSPLTVGSSETGFRLPAPRTLREP